MLDLMEFALALKPAEAKKAAEYGYPVKNEDFFSYYESEIENKEKFDVILGNNWSPRRERRAA